MDQNVVLVKSGRGSREITTRKYKLNPRLRAILIVIDGKTTYGELLAKFSQIDNVEKDIAALLKHGFIKAVVDFKKQRMSVSRAITDLLGPNADYLTMQIEDCKSIDELKTLIEDKRGMLESALGVRGKIFWEKYREIIG